MRWIASIVVFVIVSGCSNLGSSNVAYRNPCLEISFVENAPISSNEIYTLWECKRKDEAKELARQGAVRGDLALIDLYLKILASDEQEELGLAYAIKGAEVGDENSIGWVIAISKKLKIDSLKSIVDKKPGSAM
ncbi:hypothetical protein [Metapseudomonas otitidis]|uniref:hypothetical protein n=1 Tax=Metapseudomonas otitidis TaxID=319939 RepID=UPI001F489AF6|nr:hypothetical protein [Pseudomonas otitidis]